MTLQPDPLPLRQEQDGNIYVGTSRVLLDNVLHWFKQGISAEEIARNYDTITHADVYAVIAWYLRRQGEVDDYLRQRLEEADEARQRIEAAQGDLPADLKARLAAFKAQRDAHRGAAAD